MSEEAASRVAGLENELRVAQELLFLVLDQMGEPVVLNVAEARERMNNDRVIDLDLDEQADTWTLSGSGRSPWNRIRSRSNFGDPSNTSAHLMNP